MIAQASWLHGHAMEVEYRNRLASERRAGYFYGLEGNADSENWFHFAIPTPVIADDRRLKVGNVMVRYRAAGGGLIHAVHVYDGERRIAAHNGLNRSLAEWTLDRFDVPGDPDVSWGLGISIGVRFPTAGARLEIAGAGCDFLGTAP